MATRKPKADTPLRPKTTPKLKAKPKVKAKSKFYSVGVILYHPFQSIHIPGPPGIELERDSWLDSQIGVGLIKEL